ncbi:hypothetical protein KKG31_00960 [Patescibacteria group bacterium]|nr:hypothetical protein [Patescibacteria group bacterium]MBU1757750.1 hypothetical protein [Patescibacteria group bacterium]
MTIRKTAAVNLLSISARKNIIIDNLGLNGSGLSSSSIVFQTNSHSSTINDVQAYSNTTYGIQINASSKVLINNSQIFQNNSV